ncbi:unnamed protein product [Ilex paraguariensis]|uniref:Uncharacterized protein n=1 Tax=Ilex paraguariensis TaxID=185542 RepID=A0ABC8RHI7_9AQUA
MDPEAARTARESLDLLFHMSNILETGLDRHTLSVLIALCDLGLNPESLAAVVKELQRETPPSSSSSMPTTPVRDKLYSSKMILLFSASIMGTTLSRKLWVSSNEYETSNEVAPRKLDSFLLKLLSGCLHHSVGVSSPTLISDGQNSEVNAELVHRSSPSFLFWPLSHKPSVKSEFRVNKSPG